MGRPLLVGSRRDFLIGACAFLLPQSRRKILPPSVVSPIRFREIASQAGLNFVLQNNPTPRKHMIETMPGGVAAFDYNGDGLTDIFFTNGASIPSLEKDSPKFFNRLYRNDGGMKFTDVTRETGVAGTGYSMGAAAADYDNDGYTDLFVAGVYRNTLYRNLGNGRFEDVTKAAGIKSDKWSVAAGWFDYDNDGWLDLFVVNYAHWTPDFDRFCGDRDRNLRVYCHPKYFEGLSNTLYRNRRDGTFEDVTVKAGIAAHIGRGMSVAFADYDNDGLMDVFVSNDNLPNFLFHNRGDGTFEEVGLQAGVALTNNGLPVPAWGQIFAITTTTVCRISTSLPWQVKRFLCLRIWERVCSKTQPTKAGWAFSLPHVVAGVTASLISITMGGKICLLPIPMSMI